MAAVILASAAVGVHADDYLSMVDYGIGIGSVSTSVFTLTEYTTKKASSGYIVKMNENSDRAAGAYMWAFKVNSGYTYTMSFSGTYTTQSGKWTQGYSFYPYSNIKDYCFYSTSLVTAGNKATNILDNVVVTANVTYSSDTVAVVSYTVVFNSKTSNLPSIDTIYVYAPWRYDLNDADSATVTVNHFGFGCQYDPDGSSFNDYAKKIYEYGSGYPLPDDAASSLDSSVDGLTSAEGALKDKSSSLMDSVESQMSENITQAKALVTTLKPAAVQVNNIYNSFLTVLPAEVKAMFIAIPLLLFVGWLVGRIRE